MIIDFHVHAFPEKIADAAIFSLAKKVEGLVVPSHDGHLASLVKLMDEGGVDKCVLQPVVTKQSQVTKNNEWAVSVQSDRVISFGGLYPNSGEYKTDIDLIVSLGLKGIKLHPEYQEFIPDSDEMLRLYDYALSQGLIILIHGGLDLGMRQQVRATPKVFKNIARAMKGGVIVAAHLGGHAMWDEVEEVLAGENIYMDTGMGFEYFSDEQFLRIVKKHGADKILYASDAPWGRPSIEIPRIKALNLPESDKQKILGGNAERLLYKGALRSISQSEI